MVLNLNWEIIWVFVNLLILFLLMKKFLFGPITKLLDERAKGVADTLDQAETQLAEAERQKAEYTQQLASARASMSRRPVREQRTGRPCWPRHKSRWRIWCC